MTTNSPKVELEAKLMFLERTVEVMQKVVVEQGRTIGKLTERMEELERSLRMADSEEEIGPHDDPPPHY